VCTGARDKAELTPGLLYFYQTIIPLPPVEIGEGSYKGMLSDRRRDKPMVITSKRMLHDDAGQIPGGCLEKRSEISSSALKFDKQLNALGPGFTRLHGFGFIEDFIFTVSLNP
jgi:hypothetical protein